MTDIHCHILPNVDDGSKDWDMSLTMCRIAHEDGIRHIVATPHANYQYQYCRERHSELIEELRQKFPEIQFSLGCDFHLSYENIQAAVEHPERYTLGNTRYILVEFSDFETPRQMTDSLFRLHSAGFITIVSHPERNRVIDEYPDLPGRFFDMGSALQITAGALCGAWGRKPRKTAEALVRKGLVSLVATDAHEAKHRNPILSRARQAVAKLLDAQSAESLVKDNPDAVISNRSLM